MDRPAVTVWSADPAQFGDAECASLATLLDAMESERAAALRLAADRRAYVVAHGLRRLLLAQELDVAPAAIRFRTELHGRPVLAWPHAPGLSFSLAHAREGVACAVTRAGEVGIDIEPAQGTADLDLLAPFVVVPGDAQRRREAGEGEARQFGLYWTALEAFWKAHGLGLSAAQPRIRLRRTGEQQFDACFEHDGDATRRASIAFRPARGGCVMALAVVRPASTAIQGSSMALRTQPQRRFLN